MKTEPPLRGCLSRQVMIVLAVVFCLVVMTLPGGASGPGELGKKDQYRAQFVSDAGAPPHHVGTLYTDEGVQEISVGDAAELYAERMLAFEERSAERREAKERADSQGREQSRSDKGGHDEDAAGNKESKETRGQNGAATDTPVFAYGGSFRLYEKAAFGRGASYSCSNLHDRIYSHPNPLKDAGIGEEWLGAARSEIAAHGWGRVSDLITGVEIDYHIPIYYAGASDFYCFEQSGPAGGTVVINASLVDGGVIVGVDD